MKTLLQFLIYMLLAVVAIVMGVSTAGIAYLVQLRGSRAETR